jgi:hypothetical protein
MPARKPIVIPFQFKAARKCAGSNQPDSEPELQPDATLETAVAPQVAAAYEAVAHLEEPVVLVQEAPAAEEEEINLDVDSALAGDDSIEAEVHFAELAVAHARAEARLAEELERVRNEAAEQRVVELAACSPRRTRSGWPKSAPPARLLKLIPERHSRPSWQASEARPIRALAAELTRVREETAQRFTEQLQEAERARSSAVEEARAQAELEATRALESEVARIRTETEARLAAELRRATQGGSAPQDPSGSDRRRTGCTHARRRGRSHPRRIRCAARSRAVARA